MSVHHNIRDARTTHPRKRQRRQRALDRFTVKESKAGDAAYAARKAVELASLRRVLGALS